MGKGILVIGNANVDIVMGSLSAWPEEGTETVLPRSDFRAGGSAGNTVLVLRALAQPTSLISAFGNDDLGHWLAKKFKENRECCAIIDAPTSFSVGLLHTATDGSSERTFFSNAGHLDVLSYEHVAAALKSAPLTGGIALLSGAFTTPTLRADYTRLILDLRASGWQIAIDPGWPPQGWTPDVIKEVEQWISSCDYLLINDKEALALSGADDLTTALSHIIQIVPSGAQLVVKCGPKGAAARCGDQTLFASAPKVAAFDTVGAGDAFNAGYLAGILDDLSSQAALDQGVSTASNHIRSFPRNYSDENTR